MVPDATSGGTPHAPRQSDSERIGSYRTVRRIATGTTSDVILGIAEGPLGFSRQVALKMMRDGLGADTTARRMFAREATAYAQLSHACIVQLFDFFEHQGRLVMAIEYVDGAPLHRFVSLLKSSNITLHDAAILYIGQRLFAALAAAHSAKNRATGEPLALVHRDVNPSNVLVSWTGESKLGDFGLAKLTAQLPETRHLMRGTAGYLAPEQARGEDATARSDVYAAGLVLWELFTRRRAHPVGAVSDADLMLAMQAPRVVPLDVVRTDLDRRVREIVRRAIEPDVERRTMSAEEAAAALAETFDAEVGRARLEQALERIRPQAAAELAQPTPSSTRSLAGESPDTVRMSSPHGELLPQRPRISSAERDPLALLLSGDHNELGSAIDDILSEGRPSESVVSSANAARRRIDSPPPIAPSSIDAMFDRTMPLPKSEPTRRSTAPGMPAPAEHGGPPRMGPGVTLPMSARTISFEGVPDASSNHDASAPITSPMRPRTPTPPLASTQPLGWSAEPTPRSPAVKHTPAFGAPPMPEPIYTPPLPAAALTVPYGQSPEPPPVTRSEPARPSAPRHSLPPAMVPTVPPASRLNRSERRSRHLLVVALAAGSILAVGVGVGVLVVKRGHPGVAPATMRAPATVVAPPRAIAPTPAPTPVPEAPTASASVAVPVAAAPTPSVAAVPTVISTAPVSTTGMLSTEGSRPGHRIFLGARVIGETPAQVSVRCGTHVVKLGSAGKPQSIEVPCGDRIVVKDH